MPACRRLPVAVGLGADAVRRLEARRHGLLALAAFLCSAFLAAAQTNQPIDLPTALKLAGAQNLDVQIARERLRESQAAHDAALYNFFPWVAPGVGYKRHDGRIQDVTGNMFDTSKQQLAPGLNVEARLELGEAWFKALAAKQLAKAADHAVEAQRQESVFNAAHGYFDLVKARATAEVAQEASRIAGDYADQLQRGVELGLIFKGDALRARGQAERNQLAVQQAREQQRLSAARLAQVLRLDPSVDLLPADIELLPLRLTATNTALDTLVAQALGARPELKRGSALTKAAKKNRDAATVGPLIPSLGAQAFFGGLGGGRNNDLDQFGGTESVAITLGWRIGPGGIFDSTREKFADASLKAASLATDKVKDDVIRQVVEAHTRVHSLAAQLATLKRALATAEEAFRLTRERKERGFGVVLENIFAEQDLTRARSDYVAGIAEFNKAQYGLLRATGR
ncbi:MAG: TolC family protein [Verrucomicrobia bacterium]|nr:TolC family protein [Verrucomicrobiota bacterium]